MQCDIIAMNTRSGALLEQGKNSVHATYELREANRIQVIVVPLVAIGHKISVLAQGLKMFYCHDDVSRSRPISMI